MAGMGRGSTAAGGSGSNGALIVPAGFKPQQELSDHAPSCSVLVQFAPIASDSLRADDRTITFVLVFGT
jgi:hypothetical protein